MMFNVSKNRIIFSIIAILLLVTIVWAVQLPSSFDVIQTNATEIIYQHKVIDSWYVKIRMEQEHYNCLDYCRIPIYLTNNYVNGEEKTIVPSLKFENGDLPYKASKQKLKLVPSQTEEIFYVDLNVPTNVYNKKFNVSFDLGGTSYILDPSVSGCTENETHVYCQNATYTGNSIDTAKRILIVNATLDGSSGNFIRLNATNGTDTLATPVIEIRNSTLIGNGTDGTQPAEVSKTCASGTPGDQTGTVGNDGTGGYVKTIGLTYLYNVTIFGHGGDGGQGGTSTIDNGGDATSCQSTGGRGGKGGQGNFTGHIIEARNVKFYVYGGGGGEGGRGSNADVTADSNAVGGAGGRPGSGSFINLVGNNNTRIWINTTIAVFGEPPGAPGTAICSGCGGSTTGGERGNGNSSYLYMEANTYEFRSYNLTIDTSNRDKIRNGSASGSINVLQHNTSMTLNLSTEVIFRDFNISANISTINIDGTFLGRTGGNIILSSPTTNRFGFFRSTLFATDNLTVTCNAGALTVGNNTALPSNLNLANCGTITYISEGTFDESVTVNISSPENTTYDIVLLRGVANVTSSSGNSFANVSLYINSTRNVTRANNSQSPTGIINNGEDIRINATGMLGETGYTWYIEACSISGVCGTSGTRTYFFDNSTPIITLTNPSSNISLQNLTFNISIIDKYLNRTNVTVYYPNFSTFESRQNISFIISPHWWLHQVNFTQEFNYSINVTAIDSAGNQVNSSTWYFFDKSAPEIRHVSPTSNQTTTSTTLNITLNITDKSRMTTCMYRINESLSSLTQTSLTAFNCGLGFNNLTYISVTGLTDNTNYSLFVNVSDGFNLNESIVYFRVETVVGGGAVTGGGGGGGSGVSPIKPAEVVDYELKTLRGASSASIIGVKGETRSLDIILNNKGNTLKGVTMSCTGDNCAWISFKDSVFEVLGGGNFENKILITVPPEASSRTYDFIIKANYLEQERTLNLAVSVGFLSNLLKDLSIGRFQIPVIAVSGIMFLIFVFGLIPLLLFIIKGKERRLIPFISLISSMVITTIITLIIIKI